MKPNTITPDPPHPIPQFYLLLPTLPHITPIALPGESLNRPNPSVPSPIHDEPGCSEYTTHARQNPLHPAVGVSKTAVATLPVPLCVAVRLMAIAETGLGNGG
jgi:hypothetical protein